MSVFEPELKSGGPCFDEEMEIERKRSLKGILASQWSFLEENENGIEDEGSGFAEGSKIFKRKRDSPTSVLCGDDISFGSLSRTSSPISVPSFVHIVKTDSVASCETEPETGFWPEVEQTRLIERLDSDDIEVSIVSSHKENTKTPRSFQEQMAEVASKQATMVASFPTHLDAVSLGGGSGS